MSQHSVSSKKLENDPSLAKRIVHKILNRKPLSPSSSHKRTNSSGSETQSRENQRLKTPGNIRAILDTDSFIGDDDSIYDSGEESEHHDVMLNGGDLVTDEKDLDVHKNDKVEFPMFKNGNEKSDEDMPWAGLTYGALVAPKYVRVTRRSKKSPRLLNNVFLAQEFRCTPNESKHSDPDSDDDKDMSFETNNGYDKPPKGMNEDEILVMEFSRDGKYLAVAGRDARITVFQVISSPLSRLQYKNHEAGQDERSRKKRLKIYGSAPVFHKVPVRVFEGHTSTVISLDWSKNNFLISGSMDSTAKLWNVERQDCLETFRHEDFVTAVKFHPNDDRFFVSGSLDNCVRLWSVLESSVTYTKNLGVDVLITALAFNAPGNYCMVGGFNGSLFVLETNGLHYVHRLEVKEKAHITPFSHKNDNKITGIKVFENDSAVDVPKNDLAKYNILITTNDSRIRLIDLRQKKLVTRFKGSSNPNSSIVASLSEDCRYVISGSEDHCCYVWENNNSIINNKLRLALKEIYIEGKSHMNEKHKRVAKLFHENKLWKKLNMQKFVEDVNGQMYVANENNSYSSFHAHHSRVNVALFAPENTKKLLEFSDDIIYDLAKRAPKLAKAGIYPPRHKNFSFPPSTGLNDGHIIVTCDSTGLIRVYRQDSAYYVRKSLVELRKNCTHIPVSNPTPESTGINSRLMKTRSLSPTYETAMSLDTGLSLKTKFLNKLKPTSQRVHTAPHLIGDLPRQLSSRTLDCSINGDDNKNLITLASLVSLRNLNKSAQKDRTPAFKFLLTPNANDNKSIASAERLEFEPSHVHVVNIAGDEHSQTLQ